MWYRTKTMFLRWRADTKCISNSSNRTLIVILFCNNCEKKCCVAVISTQWHTPTLNIRSSAPKCQNDPGHLSTAPATTALTFTFWQISKILLAARDNNKLKDSANLCRIVGEFLPYFWQGSAALGVPTVARGWPGWLRSQMWSMIVLSF